MAEPFAVYVSAPDRFTLLHELGHAFDRQRLNDRERAEFTRLVDRPGPWLPASYGWDGDHDFAGEDFADTYAACALRYREASRSVCRFIQRAAL